ncbi:MAG: ketoacyl-ACP synthase III [Myxococcota bacterium]|nr:ketoacyl-ACP synthase III [Myxococcota bacterium]
MGLNLLGVGHFHPENCIDNAFLESLDIGTDDEWILERVGIECRRTVLPLDYIRETRNSESRAAQEAAEFSNAELGARAARLALARAGISADDVGLVIGGSCAPDTASPAEACNLARLLEIQAPALDINSACTSFLAGIHMLSMMREEALPDYILLVSMESMTPTVDYTDRSAAVLWGDAGLAAVLSTRHPGPAQILGSFLESNPMGADKVIIPRQGYFQQEGRTVQTFAIKKTGLCYDRLRERFETPSRALHFIGHQANLRMLENVCRRFEIGPDRHHSNVELYGNTGAASSGTVLSQNWDKWVPGDDIAVVGVGSGLTWASYLARFGKAETDQ